MLANRQIEDVCTVRNGGDDITAEQSLGKFDDSDLLESVTVSPIVSVSKQPPISLSHSDCKLESAHRRTLSKLSGSISADMLDPTSDHRLGIPSVDTSLNIGQSALHLDRTPLVGSEVDTSKTYVTAGGSHSSAARSAVSSYGQSAMDPAGTAVVSPDTACVTRSSSKESKRQEVPFELPQHYRFCLAYALGPHAVLCCRFAN